MGVITEHRRDEFREVFANHVVADDDERDACRSEVFLGTGIEKSEFGDIERFGKNA